MNNLELLKVYNYDNKIRLGEKSDGGYVIAELDEPLYDCYISAGISNEESFTRDFLQKYCLDKNDCYGFDGTISDYPYNYTNNITFIKKNINYYNDDENTNLSYLFTPLHI